MALPAVIAQPTPSFWARLGAGLACAARTVGSAITSTIEAVDADVRWELAGLPVMALTAIGRRRIEVAPLPDDGHRPVIFVHGLAGHRGNFRPMALWFRSHGRSRHYAIGLPVGQPAETQARWLHSFIQAVVDVNELDDDAQVDIVAHSRGGVVARLALDHVEVTRRVATLVTLGTPHRGTEVARYAAGTEVDELRPDSAVIARLQSQLPWTGPRLVCFWSDADPLVVPNEMAQVPGAENIELPGLTHCQMLLRPIAWRATLDALRED